jgi:hypothetical protein
MKSIRDIIDTTLDLGFAYFYDTESDLGYLRRMLQKNPSLETIKNILTDDITFISEIDEDYFQDDFQFKAFKKLEKHLQKAKTYIIKQLKKKKKDTSWEKKQVESEIRALDKEFRDGLIDKDEHDYAVRILLRPADDNLDEVKSKFEQIDQKVKQELKAYGFKNIPEEEEEYEPVYGEPIMQFEKQEVDIDKLVDEDNRRFTMEEFNDIYEDIQQVNEANLNPKQNAAQQQKQALALSTIIKQNEQKKKAAGRTPQQIANDKKANAAKLQQLGVDPKLIAQLVSDDKI